MSITRDQLDSWNGEVERWRSMFQDERERNAKLVAALEKIEKTCADWERIMCLPGPKEVKAVWYTARTALADQQSSTEKPYKLKVCNTKLIATLEMAKEYFYGKHVGSEVLAQIEEALNPRQH